MVIGRMTFFGGTGGGEMLLEIFGFKLNSV